MYAPVGVNDREGTVGVPFVHAPPPSLFPSLSSSTPSSSADWYLRDISHNINTRLPSSPSSLPCPHRSPRISPRSSTSFSTVALPDSPVGVAWIHYTNYIDDTSMGHEIGGALAAPIAPELFFMLPPVVAPRPSSSFHPSPAAWILRSRVFVSFFLFRAKEENNVAAAVLIMMQMIAFQCSRER